MRMGRRSGGDSVQGDSNARTSSDRGAVAIVVAVFVILGVVLLAFVVDRGRIYLTRSQLQNAVDAGALAGVQQFCLTPANPADTAEALAVRYANDNGAQSVLVDADSIGSSSYINVRASEVVDMFFGGLVGQEEVAVAAQATASRLCEINYRVVAESLVNFNGQGSTAGPIYAGACFEGSNGTFPVVSVWTLATEFDPCPDNSFGSGQKTTTIYAGSNGVVTQRNYDVPELDIVTYVPSVTRVKDYVSGTTFASVFDAITWIQNPANGALVGNCSPATGWADTQAINCSGGTGGGTLDVDDTHNGMIIANDQINLNGATIDNGLVYSRNGDITIDATTRVSQDSVLYAPNGNIRITGSGSGGDVDAVLIAQEIAVNGSGNALSTGVPLYGPGPYQLIQ